MIRPVPATPTGRAWSLACCVASMFPPPVRWRRWRRPMQSSRWERSSTVTLARNSPSASARHSVSRCRQSSGRPAEPGSDTIGSVAVAVEITDLRKSYGPVEAVRGISLTVNEGEVFALLGPNGAGKTTTVEILEGFRHRDAGHVSVLGFDPARGDRKLKEQMGIVLQTVGVDPYLTVAEIIDMYRGYYPHPRPLAEVIELVGLTEKRQSRVTKLSGGQQRRLDMAIALAGDPNLLFLDEPTTGFDPGARRRMWETVKNLVSLGKTIFLTTHYMDEAQELADRVAVISAGQIVAEGPPETLAGRETSHTIVRFRLSES